MVHRRWGVSYRSLAGSFGISIDTVERACRELRPTVAVEVVAPVDTSTQRGVQLLAAELERLNVGDRRTLIEGIGVRPCGHRHPGSAA